MQARPAHLPELPLDQNRPPSPFFRTGCMICPGPGWSRRHTTPSGARRPLASGDTRNRLDVTCCVQQCLNRFSHTPGAVGAHAIPALPAPSEPSELMPARRAARLQSMHPRTVVVPQLLLPGASSTVKVQLKIQIGIVQPEYPRSPHNLEVEQLESVCSTTTMHSSCKPHWKWQS